MSDEEKDPTPKIEISGNVSGANVNIDGTQNFAGDLVIQSPKAERICPPPPTMPEHFGGRDTQYDALSAKLKAGEAVAITAVHGVGGVGKTTLARALASRLHADKTFRAVIWADVTRTPDALAVLRGWAAFADSSFDTANLPEGQIALHVKQRLEDVIDEKCEHCEPPRVLVVLDDVWDNGKAAARLLKTACPDGSTVLITTRSESIAYDLGAAAQRLNYMNDADSVALLQTYLPRADPEKLRALGKTLGGHPLAMELAARRIKKESGRPGQTLETALVRCVADYEIGIPAGTPFADLKLEQGEQKEDNLTNSLYHSYSALDPADQARFRALGTLPHDTPFDTLILAALWEVEPEKVEDACDKLRLLSLLEAEETAAWYRQHPLLRTYARALQRTEGEVDSTFGRYADRVIAIANGFVELPPQHWRVLEPYRPHIHTVGDALLAAFKAQTAPDDILTERVLQFAVRIGNYLFRRREVRRLDWLEMGLAAARQFGDKARESLLLNDMALFHRAAGNMRDALKYYEQALLLDQASGDRSGEATTLSNIGLVYSALGQQPTALDYYNRALPILREVGDRSGEATTLNNIGGVYSDLGQKPTALDYYNQALPIQREVGDRSGEATTLSNIGLVYRSLGQNETALDYYNRALPILREVGDRSGEATTLNNIGGVYDALGQKPTALDYYNRALPILREVGNRSGEAATLNNIGGVYSDLGQKSTALDYYNQALPILREVGDRSGEATTLNNMSFIYFQNGELDRTIEIQHRIIMIFQDIGAVAQEAACRFNLAIVLQRTGELDEAIQQVEQALAILKQYNLPQDASGATVADRENFLARLRRQRDGQPEPDQTAQVMQMLAEMYQANGADAVRTLLTQNNLPDERIEFFLTLLAQAAQQAQDIAQDQEDEEKEDQA